MQSTPADITAPGAPKRNLAVHFLVMMFLYLCGVYAWSLYLYPLGRDYAAMAHPEGLAWGVRQLFAAEMRLFGTWLPGYHVVNLVLLYGVMIGIYFLTRFATRGPWWLGSFAAVFMMANPVKAEAVLNLSGVSDLLPALFAVATMAGYAAHVRRPRVITFLLTLAAFTIACAMSRSCFALLLVLALYEKVSARRYERIWMRLAPFAVTALLFCWLQPGSAERLPWRPETAWMPLYFVLYPMGFLPETLARFQEHPALLYVSAGIIAALFALLSRMTQHRALVFGVLAALAWRIAPLERGIDPVHLVGGGQLLVPAGLLGMAFASVCHRIVQHPKWHRPTVFLTSALCVILFVGQVRGIGAWKRAGEEVQAFQARAAAAAEEHPGQDIAVAPDFQYYRGAPMALSAAASYNTLFSQRLPIIPLFTLHLPAARQAAIRIEAYSPREVRLAVHGASPQDLATPDAKEMRWFSPYAQGVVTEEEVKSFKMVFHPNREDFPEHHIDCTWKPLP